MSSSNPEAASKQTFTPFSRLPQEIREEIWMLNYLSAGIRVIRIGVRTVENCTDDHGDFDNRNKYGYGYFKVTGAEEPLLLVCAESKRLVMKKSHGVTGFKSGGYELKDHSIWLRLDSDIFVLESRKEACWDVAGITKCLTAGLVASSLKDVIKSITVDLVCWHPIWNLIPTAAGCPQLQRFNFFKTDEDLAPGEIPYDSRYKGDRGPGKSCSRGGMRDTETLAASKRLFMKHMAQRAEDVIKELQTLPETRWISTPEFNFKVMVEGESSFQSIDEWVEQGCPE